MKALWFVNALGGQALEFFCEKIDENTTVAQMVHGFRIIHAEAQLD